MSETELSPAKKRLYTRITIIFAIVLALATGEIMVRILRPQRTYGYLLDIVGHYYVPGEFIPFSLKPNYQGPEPSQEHPGTNVTISINSLGLRGHEISQEKPAGTSRIIALGDSFTFGVYVENNETYEAKLEQLYQDDHRPVEVINAGYADGWGPDTEYVWLNRKGFDFGPDIVVYGFYPGNDLLDINPDHWVQVDEHGLPTKIVDDNISVDELGRIRSKKPDYTTADDSWIYQVPLLRESHMFVYVGGLIKAMSHPDYGTGDLLFKAQTPDYLKPREEKFKQLVEAMKTDAESHGAHFVMLMLPFNVQVNAEQSGQDIGIKRNYFNDLKPWLAEKQIAYVDLLDAMEAHPGHYFPSNGEVHLNPEGHQFAAETLKAFFDSQGWLKDSGQ